MAAFICDIVVIAINVIIYLAIIRPLKINYSILIPARLNFYPPLQPNLFGSVLS